MRPDRPRLATTVELPGGGCVLARGLARTAPPVPPPDHGLYLLGHPLDRPGPYGRLLGLTPWVPPWPHDRIDWPDFTPPRDPATAIAQLRATLGRIDAGGRVEIACGGGRGRTGTALAALAVLRGLDPDAAVSWVRQGLHPRAVETRRQRAFLVTAAAGR